MELDSRVKLMWLGILVVFQHNLVESHGRICVYFWYIVTLPFSSMFPPFLQQDGYETDVGEKSALLSGGQKQVTHDEFTQ